MILDSLVTYFSCILNFLKLMIFVCLNTLGTGNVEIKLIVNSSLKSDSIKSKLLSKM